MLNHICRLDIPDITLDLRAVQAAWWLSLLCVQCGKQKLMEKRTVEDELQSDPKLAKEVDEEITKGSYY